MLTTPSHLFIFKVFGNGFWEDLLAYLPGVEGDVDWLVALWILFLALFLKIAVAFAFFQSFGTSPNHPDLSKIVETELLVLPSPKIRLSSCAVKLTL